jgi:hypothetical protein
VSEASSDPVGVVSTIGLRHRVQVDLEVGRTLSFGRAADCDIILQSTHISRRAGLLNVGPHFVAVTRLHSSSPRSGKLWVHLFDAAGPVLVPPGGTVAVDVPSAEIHLTLDDPGRTWNPYEVRSNLLFGTPVLRLHLTTSMRDPSAEEDSDPPLDGDRTLETLTALRRHPHHVVLVALVAPLFDVVAHGAQLPSNREIAERLTAAGHPQKSDTVRNRLYTWKKDLGIAAGSTAGASHYQLALLAQSIGLVTRDDVERLDSLSS